MSHSRLGLLSKILAGVLLILMALIMAPHAMLLLHQELNCRTGRVIIGTFVTLLLLGTWGRLANSSAESL